MPTLWLFGVELNLTDNGAAFHFSGKLENPQHGPFVNNAEATLTKDTQGKPGKLLSLQFKGDVPFGFVDFQSEFDCEVENDHIRLLNIHVGGKKIATTVKLKLPLIFFEPERTLTAPRILVGEDYPWEKEGVGFSDQQITLREGLLSIPVNISLATAEWSRKAFWSSFDLSVNFTVQPLRNFDDPHAVFRPIAKGPNKEIAFIDLFQDSEPFPQIQRERDQFLGISVVTATATEVRIFSYPLDHALLIHPDILNTQQAASPENDILYQHALANGFLEFVHRAETSTHGPRVRWQKANDGQPGDAALVTFRLSDEHGNPLIMKAPFFPLASRQGIDAEVKDGDLPDRWESTIRGVVIQARGDKEKQALRKLNLTAIDPLKLNPNNSEHEFHWLVEGTTAKEEAKKLVKNAKAVVSGTAPSEIHGLGKGFYLEWVNSQVSLPQIPCQLETTPIVNANGHIYTQTDVLIRVGDWAVRNQLEERETYLGTHYVNIENPEKTVGMREARADESKENQFLRLPLIDTVYALSNLVGENRPETALAKATLDWTNRINNQFTNARTEHAQDPNVQPLFKDPDVKMQTHITGFTLKPPDGGRERFYAIDDYPRAEATTIRDTARTAANMVSAVNTYVHGGERDTSGAIFNQLEAELKNKLAEDFQLYAREFEKFWNSLWSKPAEKEIREARDALREFLSRRPLTLPPGSEAFFADTLAKAKELVHSAKEIPGVGKEFNKLTALIPADMTPDKFITDVWATNPVDDPLRRALLDYLWSPGGIALYRQALEAVYPNFVQEGAKLAAELKDYEAVLLAQVRNFVNDALPPAEQIKQFRNYLENSVPGVLTKARHGIDDMYRKLIAVWEEGWDKWDAGQKAAWAKLRKTYSPIFSPDVYTKLLLTSEDDARKLVELFNAAKDKPPIGLLLNQLKDLKVEPPAYFFYTQRFPLEQVAGSPDMEWLWRRPFDLCRLGSNKFWNFLLDKESSVIVKLSGAQSMADIIRELHDNYRSESRKNPLGLVVTDEKKDFVADFISHLHPDILAPHWRGILIINPMADIAKDEQLSTLCGFRYIGARYVAIGGSKLEVEEANLDIYANIFKQSSSQEADGSTDVALTVVKFDVTIKHTQLESGEIVLRLDLQNLWGRDKKDLEAQFKEIYIRGSLPREEKTSGEKQAPSSFEFAAWLPKPYQVNIDLAFIKAFEFKTLRVGKNKGQTSIEIDGDILLKSWGSSIGGQNVPINEDGQADDRIALNNFRILVPKLDPGKSLPMGMPRLLNFELPAVSLNLRRPRSFNLWGMEITPHGLGFIRNQAGGDAGPLKKMHDEYVWLFDIDWPDLAAPSFVFPFIKCDVEFGQLPIFGGTGASQLRFEMLMGLFLESGKAPRIAIGLSGLEARDLHLNIFGLLKLEIERLLIGSFQAQLPDHSEPPQTVTAISAEDVRLTILDWSVLPSESRLELLFMHETKPENHRGVLGWYWQEPNNDSFFRLHWVLLCKGIDPGKEVMDHLLAPTPNGEGSKLLKGMIDTEANPKKIKARVTPDGNWLFGASFGLGEIIKQGSFIIHDQHYYGISLTAPWLEPLIGSDRLMLAYIPGATRSQDRFRTSFRLPAFDLLGNFRSGDIALEWAFNWDYLLDIGFPWKGSAGYQWERAFSVPAGTYEAKFGLYIEKRTQTLPATTGQRLTIAAGAGLYVGYYFGFQSPIVWLRAGIGVFAILEGSITFELSIGSGLNPFKGAIVEIMVRGVIGIYAYGEGGIDVWVLSARFRVSVQAALAGELHYLPNGGSSLSYAATLSAGYSASVRVGCGFFSFTFSVSGSVEIGVSGRLLLN